MKRVFVLRMVIAAVVLLTASVASAHTTWTRPAASGVGNWKDADNWNAGVPAADGSNVYAYAGYGTSGLAEIQVTDAQYTGTRMYQGNYTPTYTDPVVRIMNGGSLTFPTAGSRGHIYIGANCTAHMIIETGGMLTPYSSV